MSKTIFKSNAQVLTEILLDSGKTLMAASAIAGVAPGTLAAAMRRDQRLSLKTASKLRAAFGDNVIRCEHLKGGETR